VKISVLGVGEAFDPHEGNSSVLVEEAGFRLMIDCGHAVPPALWRRGDGVEIDAIYLTHHHPDHVFGLVPVLDAFVGQGRRKGLEIITTAWGIEHVKRLCEVGLLDLASLPYAVSFRDLTQLRQIGPWTAAFAATEHSVVNHAIKLGSRGRDFAYSGDGRPTAASRALFAGADLLFHECHIVEELPPMKHHADIATVRGIEGPRRIGVYHLRSDQRPLGAAAVAGDARLFLPKAGDVIEFGA
jgi:ribonuclease BN (tRNA processing enzyme)